MANGRGSAMHAFVLVLNAHLSASHSLWPDERSSIPDDGIEPGQFLNAYRFDRDLYPVGIVAMKMQGLQVTVCIVVAEQVEVVTPRGGENGVG